MKVAVVTPAIQNPNRLFGAERHFVGMVAALQQAADADWIQVPVGEASWEGIQQSYLDCFDLDLSSYDLVVSTKSPTYMTQHPNHICWLLHQVRVFYDRFDDEYGNLPEYALAQKREQRDTVRLLDNLAFQNLRKIFTNGHETARRLKQYNGFEAEVLHPPVLSSGHYCGLQEYFLLPGRLHRWKRVDLALRAMQHVRSHTPLLVSGTGEDEQYFKKLAGHDPRIRFLGFVSDAELIDLYANSLAVLFVPKEEDFGYISIEAMLSHKPVIVCTDSGEPARLIDNGRSGFVVAPDPAEIGNAMSLLDADHALARDMGEAGYQRLPSQDWDAVVHRLLQTAAAPQRRAVAVPAEIEPEHPISILVADNQVLDPPVGGGRVRIYELYRHLAALGFEVTYVGTFDWPGPVYRDQKLAPHFREVVTPLTQPHFAHNAGYQRAAGGKTTMDVTIPRLLKHTPRFQRMAEEHGRDANVIIISHPWVYPYVPRRPEQKLIYDSHNCEYFAKRQILGNTRAGRELVNDVRELEAKLCRDADLVFVCSPEDGEQFVNLYGISRDKLVSVPNGVDVEKTRPATPEQQVQARRQLGLPAEKPVLIFIGSGYGPNTEAAAFLVKEVAPVLNNCTIAIAGSVKDSYEAAGMPALPANVVMLGTIDEQQRSWFYQAADIALNPMFSGSGTNLKMLDYFAAGLPVVSTPAGARGLEISDQECVVCSPESFTAEIAGLLRQPEQRSRLGDGARQLAVSKYSWSRIAAHAAESMVQLMEVEPAHVS